jgi:hypothetical protein
MPVNICNSLDKTKQDLRGIRPLESSKVLSSELLVSFPWSVDTLRTSWALLYRRHRQTLLGPHCRHLRNRRHRRPVLRRPVLRRTRRNQRV